MKFNLKSKQIFDMKNDDYEEEAEPAAEKSVHNETSDKKSAGKYSTLSHFYEKKKVYNGDDGAKRRKKMFNIFFLLR